MFSLLAYASALKHHQSTLQRRVTLASAEQLSLAEHYIGHDVIDEAMKLLERIEDDKLSTQKMLVNERQRVNNLGTQIDEFALKLLLPRTTC